jgi:hypothetical protein
MYVHTNTLYGWGVADNIVALSVNSRPEYAICWVRFPNSYSIIVFQLVLHGLRIANCGHDNRHTNLDSGSIDYVDTTYILFAWIIKGVLASRELRRAECVQ